MRRHVGSSVSAAPYRASGLVLWHIASFRCGAQIRPHPEVNRTCHGIVDPSRITLGSFTAVTLSRHFPIIPDLTVDPPLHVFDNISTIRGDLIMGVKSPDHVDVEVGQRIRIQRNTLGLSQTELADHLGVTFQQVQKYEKGVNRVGAGRLTKIATALQLPVTNLLGVDDSIGGKRKGHDENVVTTQSPNRPRCCATVARLRKTHERQNASFHRADR